MDDLYSEIRERSKQDYGQKFEEWAPRILVDQYSDRTHFIFELIQNAEGAGATYVTFSLYPDRLVLCHNGKPFTEADIQGICGIRSTKDEPESGKIGRFGIGFKSVYAYTKTPRIYSGQYSFRICNLVLPYAEENEATGDDTILILPFDGEVNPETAYNEIGDALKKYLSSDVLFALCNVRNISCKIYPDENEWSVSKEFTQVDNGVDKVLLTQKPIDSAKKLLVFRTQDKQPILIGYELETDGQGKDRVIPTEQHYLYVFFQTAVETHQTFYIHVPFSTTPARDNVRHNEVNQFLAEKLAALFADSVRWLLKNGYVTLEFLNEVYPILDTCKEENLRGIHEMGLALLRDGLALLPTEEGGYCSIQNAMLPYAKNIADNITQSILQKEYGDTACWVKADVCLGVNEHLMMYLTHHFGLPVLRWRDVLPRLTAEILENQSDEWLLNLFETIYSTCTGVFRSKEKVDAKGIPFVRLQDGSHIRCQYDGMAQVYLNNPTSCKNKISAAILQDQRGRNFYVDALGIEEYNAIGLPFVKIKNQDATVNLKITSFRFFLDDFSHLGIQCVLCIRIEKDVDVVSCVSDSHGQQSVSGAMFGQCDSFAHLRFSFYNVCSLSFGWVCDFFCSSAALLSFNFFSTDSFSGVLPPGAESCCLFSTMSIYLRIFFSAERAGCKVSSWVRSSALLDCSAENSASNAEKSTAVLPFSFIRVQTALLKVSSSSLCWAA